MESSTGHGLSGVPSPLPYPAGTAGLDARPGRPRPAILVVDDEPMVIRVIEMFLDGEGYDLVTATNADDARARLAENAGRIALLLIDRVLPDADGLALLREIVGTAGTIPAILMSGAVAPDDLGDLAGLTPVSFLAKPFRADVLCRAVDAALAAAPRVGHS
jgi:CheY-like chemotaxis protein